MTRPPRGIRRSGIGAGPIEISTSTWAAFDRAVARAVQRRTDRELIPTLNALQTAVREIAAGSPPDLQRKVVSPLLPRALDRVRRRFVEELQAGGAADAQQGIHVLSALGHVQHLIDTQSRPDAAIALAEGDGFDIVAEVAHDMRSPLAAILFLVDMLSSGRSGPVSPQQIRQLRLIYSASLGLMQLACDLVDSSRIEERFGAEGASAFSVSELLTDVLNIVQPIAEERGVSVSIARPKADERIGIGPALHRILLNLATNAIKFTHEGTVLLEAKELTGSRVEFSVHDSSREIPAPVLAQIFDPLRRESSRRRTFSSSGLGLSICHRLVAALGSTLRVTTSPSAGTRFYFVLDLPLAESDGTD